MFRDKNESSALLREFLKLDYGTEPIRIQCNGVPFSNGQQQTIFGPKRMYKGCVQSPCGILKAIVHDRWRFIGETMQRLN